MTRVPEQYPPSDILEKVVLPASPEECVGVRQVALGLIEAAHRGDVFPGWRTVLPTDQPGITAATFIGLGKAVSLTHNAETAAVGMVFEEQDREGVYTWSDEHDYLVTPAKAYGWASRETYGAMGKIVPLGTARKIHLRKGPNDLQKIYDDPIPVRQLSESKAKLDVLTFIGKPRSATRMQKFFALFQSH